MRATPLATTARRSVVHHRGVMPKHEAHGRIGVPAHAAAPLVVGARGDFGTGYDAIRLSRPGGRPLTRKGEGAGRVGYRRGQRVAGHQPLRPRRLCDRMIGRGQRCRRGHQENEQNATPIHGVLLCRLHEQRICWRTVHSPDGAQRHRGVSRRQIGPHFAPFNAGYASRDDGHRRS